MTFLTSFHSVKLYVELQTSDSTEFNLNLIAGFLACVLDQILAIRSSILSKEPVRAKVFISLM